ncbi:hypothetical protein FRC07_002326 [Ceratobasidium sp. 392]|nr:hypothetical protein FRC07_002326 [Ceratobasidium sp. 392]
MSRPSSSLTPIIPRSRATHPNLHIRTAHDAHLVFEAVRRGLMPMITHRLSAADRDLLRSGEVFCWEEADYKGGLERWTDGRKWSQSRMREPFLFYTENVMMTPEEKEAKAARRARKPSDPRERTKAPQVFRRQDRPAKPDGLTKQTYSAWVTLPGTTTPRKWHLTAYFTSNDYHGLPTVEQDPILSQLSVPPNVYVTGKGLTRKSDRDRRSSPSSIAMDDEDQRSSHSSDCGVSPLTPSPISSFSQYRNPAPTWAKGGDPTASPWSASSTISLAPNTPPLPSPLSHHQPQQHYLPPPRTMDFPPVRSLALPPLQTTEAERYYGAPQPSNGFATRSEADYRAVNSFRLQL